MIQISNKPTHCPPATRCLEDIIHSIASTTSLYKAPKLPS